MKTSTRSFYADLVQRAAARLAATLDGPVDLAALAREAALAPLHFHHVFRGVAGETPLGLHRRLRLERAAWRLAHGAAPVTALAFEAGYESHEAFTRAFAAAYGAAPSALRQKARAARAAGTRPPTLLLPARSGLHHADPPAAPRPFPAVEVPAMDVTLHTLRPRRVAAVEHRGPYQAIFEAFARLDGLARRAGLLDRQGLELVGLYHDDPEATPAADLRAHAGLVVPAGVRLPRGLTALTLPGGRWARAVHEGPYQRLGDAWARLLGAWLPASDERLREAPSYERYLNTPETAAPDELRTELWIPLAPRRARRARG